MFFSSRSFAVVGAAREPEKAGHIIFRNLLENKNIKVYAVNPNASEVLGERAYKNLKDVNGSIDCAVIVVKSDYVLDVMKDAVAKKVKCVILISAGFSEAGNSELEKKVKDIAEKNNIALLGPNVLGLISVQNNINASFFEGMPVKGSIALVSQSGALGVGILDIAMKEGIGFSGFVSLGNCALSDFSDFIEYFSSDKNTKVIALYLESLKTGRGKRFLEVCKKCKKPIVVLKSGKSVGGSKAAASHTSALASEQGVYEGIFRQAGVIEVDSISELLNSSRLIDCCGKFGKRACVVTNAGGLGVLCTDACEKNLIEVVRLPSGVQDKLNLVLPSGWSHNNPVDILGDALAERYEKVFGILEKENFFDFYIVLLTPQYMTQSVETARLMTKLKKPVVACFFGGEKVEEARKILKENKILVFDDPADVGVVGKIIS